jgi:outer membrane protein TolC
MKAFKQTALLIAFFVSIFANGQDQINTILASIEKNNPTIAAFEAQMEYSKAEVRINLLPPNPSLEGGRFPAMEGAGIKYAWGVSQQFEFPTVYTKRKQLAKTSDKLADVFFSSMRQEILLEAKLTLLDLIQAKRNIAYYHQREDLAKSILNLTQQKFVAGQSNVLELNNARMRVTEASQNLHEAEGKVSLLNQKLFALNGYIEIGEVDTILTISPLPSKEILLGLSQNNDPRFKAIEIAVEQSEDELQLTRHQGLPELNIGFQSEKTDAEHFAGFMAGVSIPLWGNRGNRRAAELHHNTVRLEQHSHKLQLETEFEQLYIAALNFSVRLNGLKQALNDYSNIILLQKALEMGHISIIEFYNEVTFLYGVTDKVLELELEYAKCYAELHRWGL